MKTSKIIFISLLGTIAILILAALVDIRIRGHRNSDVAADFKVTRLVLPSFKVLSISHCMNVSLVQSDSAFIEVTSLKDTIAPKINYTISGDTLRLSDFVKLWRSDAVKITGQDTTWISTSQHKPYSNVSVRIHATDSLKRIIVESSSYISLSDFRAGKLSLELDKSWFMIRQDKEEQPALKSLDIVAKNNSRITTNKFNVDLLEIVLQHSEANLEIIAKKISGTLSDSSKIYARQPGEISLKKDETSRINVND